MKTLDLVQSDDSALPFSSSVIAVAMSLYYQLSKTVRNHAAVSAVKYLSGNLNVIYIIQWLLISYMIAIFSVIGIPNLSVPMIIPTACMILLASAGICELYLRIKKNRKKKQSA